MISVLLPSRRIYAWGEAVEYPGFAADVSGAFIEKRCKGRRGAARALLASPARRWHVHLDKKPNRHSRRAAAYVKRHSK